MISFKGLVGLLVLPTVIFIQVMLHHFRGKGPYRKYHNSKYNASKLTVCKTIISMRVRDVHYLNLMSNKFQLNLLLPTMYKSITSKMPGLGDRYDDNSLWITTPETRSKSDPIVIYLHGGGFFLEASLPQYEAMLSIRHLLDPKVQKKTSFLLLDYKLASAGYPLPYQLNQLADTYKKLTEEDGNSNIILMGDSAGGNLAIGFLQHLKKLNKPCTYPRSLVLISPWTKMSPDHHQRARGNSYGDNEHRDMIPFALGNPENLDWILGESRIDDLVISPNNHPLSMTHWEDIPTLSEPNHSVFLLCGEDETFRDDVLEWAHYAVGLPHYNAHKYGDSNNEFCHEKHYYEKNDGKSPHVRAFVEPWGIHDASMFIEGWLAGEIKKNPSLTLKDVDREEHFGLVRIVEFLNDTLASD